MTTATLPDRPIPRQPQPEEAIKGRSLGADAWRRLLRNRAAVVSALLLAVIAIACFGARWFGPYPIDDIDWENISTPPSATHWFGTDENGRDLFTRTLYGGQVSLMVGIVATLVSLVIGVAWGAIAGLIGGRRDCRLYRRPGRCADDAHCRYPLFAALYVLRHPSRGVLRPQHPPHLRCARRGAMARYGAHR